MNNYQVVVYQKSNGNISVMKMESKDSANTIEIFKERFPDYTIITINNFDHLPEPHEVIELADKRNR